jgi:hypothetical protein
MAVNSTCVVTFNRINNNRINPGVKVRCALIDADTSHAVTHRLG